MTGYTKEFTLTHLTEKKWEQCMITSYCTNMYIQLNTGRHLSASIFTTYSHIVNDSHAFANYGKTINNHFLNFPYI